MAKGDVAKGFAAAEKALQFVPLLKFIPNWLLALLVGRMFRAEAKHPKPNGVNDYPPIMEIAPSVQFDFRIVAEMHGHADIWSAISTEVRVLGGGKSSAFLNADLDQMCR